MGAIDNGSNGPILARGRAIGCRSVTGRGRFVSGAEDFAAFQPGEILLAEYIAPDWPEALGGAAALVISRSIDPQIAEAARRLDIPAVAGATDAASPLWTGATLTVRCDGTAGTIHETRGEPA